MMKEKKPLVKKSKKIHYKENQFVRIPFYLLEDERVPWGAKALFGNIVLLTKTKGFCWASNQTFALTFKTQPLTIQRWIRCLKETGYITDRGDFTKGKRKLYIARRKKA